MWYLVLFVVVVVGSGLGAFLFVKNNPNKTKQAEDVVNKVESKVVDLTKKL